MTAKTSARATIKVSNPAIAPINRKIELAAWRGLERKIPGIPTAEFLCLQFARLVVENAMGLRSRGFYDLVTGEDSNPSANELELLLKRQRKGWVVAQGKAAPGDLAWWYDQPKGWGHVGILVRYNEATKSRNSGPLWVAQNTMLKRGIQFFGALRLIPLATMGSPTTIIRIGG